MADKRKRKSRGLTASPPSPKPAGARQASVKQAQTEQHWVERYQARGEARNAEVRATMEPLEPGEHPWPLTLAVVLALIFSLGTLALMLAGVKVDGQKPANSWIFYVVVMLVCAIGMWKHWFQAVLAFLCLLALAMVVFALKLTEASNILGIVYPVAFLGIFGFLFWKLVRVLGRLQMPERPQRASR